jgi:hypothetical protein
MPTIKMLKRLWTYRRKRTEVSFRGFEILETWKFLITNTITSHEHVFFRATTQNYDHAQSPPTRRFSGPDA